MSLTCPQRVQQQQTSALLRGKAASMAAWHLDASARVRVAVSMLVAQSRNFLQTSLTFRWSVGSTTLRMLSRSSFGTRLKGWKEVAMLWYFEQGSVCHMQSVKGNVLRSERQ